MKAWHKLVIALAAVALLMLILTRRDESPAAPELPARSAGVSPPSAASPPLPAKASVRAPAEAPHPSRPPTELCGQMKSGLIPAEDSLLQHQLQAQVSELRARAIAQLEQGDSERQQLAGALLRGDLAQVARLARSSGDGEIYGIALRACDAGRPGALFRAAASADTAAEMPAAVAQQSAGWSALCETLTLDRWAQLEPANAAPWLYRLHEAQQRGDRGIAIEALYRAGQASTLSTGESWLSDQLAVMLPQDVSPLARVTLLIETRGREAAVARLTEAGVLGRFCRGGEIADANSRQACTAAALMIAQQAPDLTSRMAGVAIARKLGADTRALDEPVLAASSKWLVEGFDAQMQATDACAAARQLDDFLRDRARRGEVAAIRSRVNGGFGSSSP